MPIVYGPQSCLVVMEWSSTNFASGAGATILGFDQNAVGPPDGPAHMANVLTAWQNYLRPVQDTNVGLASLRWETATDSGGEEVGMGGAQTLEGPPPNVALLVNKPAEGKGPRTRGRNFWPGFVGEADVSERGFLSGARLSTLVNAFNDFFTSLNYGPGLGDLALPQTIREDANGVPIPGQSSPIVPWPLVHGLVVSNLVATQRRRLRR